jgi:hypothetical protein
MARKNTKTVDPKVDETLKEAPENNAEIVGGDESTTDENTDVKENTDIKSEEKAEVKVPENVEELMRLYPQYEQFYVTPKGYLRPVGTPEYLLKGAVLYKNKFFNK